MIDYETRFCTSTDGTRIGYARFGSGPPTVLIPGWIGSEDEFQREEMSEFLSIVCDGRTGAWMSRRGTASSQREVDEITLDASVEDVRAVAQNLAGGRACAVMGVGDGAAVAGAFAARSPELVSKLVLVSAYADGRRFSPSEQVESVVALIRGNWRLARRTIADIVFPRGPADEQLWLAKLLDSSLTPEVAAKYVRFQSTVDVSTARPPRTRRRSVSRYGWGCDSSDGPGSSPHHGETDGSRA